MSENTKSVKIKMLNRSSVETKYRLPKIPSLNHSTLATLSPSNSFYQSFSHTPVAASAEKARKVPRLNTKPLPYQSKRGQVDKNPIDNELLIEYKKTEIKRSRKIQNDQYPYWFIDTFAAFDFTTSKDDLSLDQINQTDRSGFLSWCEDLCEKNR